ncbi:uncharacterized protein LOC120685907 isoform X2 [Panicum virgatum]|uniref:uncharacterized protein LOC120685907 isoform X2 n=1 Tax=Panicum virgatum TaxID=38727 RepID=UPI0019D5AE59|nr:uncharacterized protein LOC120685907 isoform X2 [Panicum virgatum]
MNTEAQDRCADETIQGQPPHVPNDDEFLQMGQQQLPDILQHGAPTSLLASEACQQKSASFDHIFSGSALPNNRIISIDQPSEGNKNGTPLGLAHASIGVTQGCSSQTITPKRQKTQHSSMNSEAQDRCADETTQGHPLHVPNEDELTKMGQQQLPDALSHEKSASFDHMLGSGMPNDRITPIDQPSVNKNGTPLGSTHPSIGVTVRGNMMNPSVPVSLNPSRWDDSAPSFRLIEEFDDYGNYIDDPRKRRQVGLPCDGKTIYDDPTCLESINVSSQESPDVCVTGHKAIVASPEVQITREKSFNTACNTMLYEVNQRYNNESDMSCFQKCQRIGFNLGSSSAGKRSRRPRRIAQPNSYFRNFQVNVCNAKFTTSVLGKLAYDCLMFYSSIPDYSSKELINYDNVRVTFGELGRSLSRSNKKSVHIHVINAFCRKLFKDKHPKDSHKHYFFSPIGDYLMNHEGKQSYMFEKCGKCFRLANGSFNFVESDYLFFPIFHEDHWFLFIVALQDGYFVFLDSFFDEYDMYQKEARSLVILNFLRAWDQFIGIDWNFDEFVIHHAPVPKQKTKQDTK